MNEETYRIKPLEWKESCLGFRPALKAKTLLGDFWVSLYHAERIDILYPGDGGTPVPVDSIDDGKAKCEAIYRERLLSALEPVPCKETT